MSKVCLSLTGESLKENAAQTVTYSDYIDMVELRADFLLPEERKHISRFPGMIDKPVILTVRRERDGGHYAASEEDRARTIEKGLSGDYAFVDLESDFYSSIIDGAVREKGITVIRSCHDFTGATGDIASKVANLPGTPNEIPKLAVEPHGSGELLNLIRAYKTLKEKKRDIILLGIGEFGFPTRILSGRLGSMLTFCSPPDKKAAAGHIDPATLHETYRFSELTEKTKIYGIIGNPVLHSKSPIIHNRGYSEAGYDAVYIPFHTDDVAFFLEIAAVLGIRGVSVTMPFKREVIPFLEKTADEVTVTGACNTVVRGAAGWEGYNFDIHGFIVPLLSVFGGDDLKGVRASVIGAGGAATSVVYALSRCGADVRIFNRTKSKADDLARRFGCSSAGLDEHEKIADYSDVVVQTTGVGMHPLEDKNPVPHYEFSGEEIAYDLIYAPSKTVFLKNAEKAGCTILNGERMLIEQAKKQFLYFTGISYPDKIDISSLLR